MSQILDTLSEPIVLAPLAGGPATPALTAAVSQAGGLGFLAAGYRTADAVRSDIGEVRRATARPFGVNLFTPGDGPSDPARYGPWVERVQRWAAAAGLPVGEPRYSDDDWTAKLELLLGDPVPVVSVTFGCPDAATVAALRAAGSEVWVTVTAPAEARLAAAAGADALVVQGAEAGGHRGSFADDGDLEPIGLLALLALVRAAVSLPLIGGGGATGGESVAAVLAAGAGAAAVGSGFLLAAEAGTSLAHRAALRGQRPTVLTRAFSGRLARGLANDFIAAHGAGAPAAYPELHHVTAPLRRHAREHGDGELINLWAGEAHALARELPAAQIVAELAGGARAALAAAAQRWDR